MHGAGCSAAGILHEVPVHVSKAPLYDLFASGARGASTTDSVSIISDWSSKSKTNVRYIRREHAMRASLAPR